MYFKSYEIRLLDDAEKFLKKLRDGKAAQRLRDTIDSLATNPHPPGHKKLVGASGYRIRVGDYRIIYEIENERLIILVVTIGHRSDVYR